MLGKFGVIFWMINLNFAFQLYYNVHLGVVGTPTDWPEGVELTL